MHAIAWILVIWGAQSVPDSHSLGSLVAVYTSERKCIAAGIDKTTGNAAHRVAKYAVGVQYRCDSVPFDPPLGQAHDDRDYRSVPEQK